MPFLWNYYDESVKLIGKLTEMVIVCSLSSRFLRFVVEIIHHQCSLNMFLAAAWDS